MKIDLMEKWRFILWGVIFCQSFTSNKYGLESTLNPIGRPKNRDY